MKSKTKLIATLLSLACASLAWGTEYTVPQDGTLTGLLTTAVSNDTIWLTSGSYTGNYTIGAGVTVRSLTGLPADVVLDGNAAGSVVTMESGSWLIGCTVSNGSSDCGGGIRGPEYDSIVSNCVITHNYSTVDGGGIYALTAYNCLICENTASNHAGGANVATLYNCTIVNNHAGNWIGGASWSSMVNCISWGNTGTLDDFTYATLSFSCGVGAAYANAEGSITNNPLFVSSTDFRLQSTSPCRDTGTNGAWTAGATDLDGKARISPIGGIVDMGCYERFTLSFIGVHGGSGGAIPAASIGAVRGNVR